MGGTIGKRRPYAKGIYIVIDDKATYIPVMDFKDEDKICSSLDITNKT